MKKINIKEATANFLIDYFKKFVGKYIYFTYSTGDEELMSVFFVKEVELRKGEAKAKICYYDKSENKLLNGRLGNQKRKNFLKGN